MFKNIFDIVKSSFGFKNCIDFNNNVINKLYNRDILNLKFISKIEFYYKKNNLKKSRLYIKEFNTSHKLNVLLKKSLFHSCLLEVVEDEEIIYKHKYLFNRLNRKTEVFFYIYDNNLRLNDLDFLDNLHEIKLLFKKQLDFEKNVLYPFYDNLDSKIKSNCQCNNLKKI